MMESKYPGSHQVPPMRYANKPGLETILKTWESGEWIAQEKKDGAWYQLEKTDDGHIYLFGRTVSKVTGEYTEKSANVPHIVEWAQKYLPNGTTLVGEIYIPGGKSNDVTKIMGCTPENAKRRQYEPENFKLFGGPVHYYVFDCIRYRGEDLCDESTIDRIDHYLNWELVDLFDDEPYIELAETYYKDFANVLKNIFATGGEGMVFKKKDCPYRAGKRTTASQMYKYKEHMDSIDLVCMELLDPVKEYTGKELDTWDFNVRASDENRLQGKYKWLKEHGYDPIAVTKPYYYKWKNAMRLGAYKDGELVEVCRVASGLTDEDREAMAFAPDAYLGKVIEIECMSINKKDGTVRHPVFRRVRTDKGPDDCLYDEIFGG